MSIVTEKLLFCDGGNLCPEDGPYGCADGRNDTAAEQRRQAKDIGWIRRKGKDYCPECANRLGYVNGGSGG